MLTFSVLRRGHSVPRPGTARSGPVCHTRLTTHPGGLPGCVAGQHRHRQAAPDGGFAAAGPHEDPAGPGGRSAHADRLPSGMRKMNPPQDACDRPSGRRCSGPVGPWHGRCRPGTRALPGDASRRGLSRLAVSERRYPRGGRRGPPGRRPLCAPARSSVTRPMRGTTIKSIEISVLTTCVKLSSRIVGVRGGQGPSGQAAARSTCARGPALRPAPSCQFRRRRPPAARLRRGRG